MHTNQYETEAIYYWVHLCMSPFNLCWLVFKRVLSLNNLRTTEVSSLINCHTKSNKGYVNIGRFVPRIKYKCTIRKWERE